MTVASTEPPASMVIDEGEILKVSLSNVWLVTSRGPVPLF